MSTTNKKSRRQGQKQQNENSSSSCTGGNLIQPDQVRLRDLIAVAAALFRQGPLNKAEAEEDSVAAPPVGCGAPPPLLDSIALMVLPSLVSQWIFLRIHRAADGISLAKSYPKGSQFKPTPELQKHFDELERDPGWSYRGVPKPVSVFGLPFSCFPVPVATGFNPGRTRPGGKGDANLLNYRLYVHAVVASSSAAVWIVLSPSRAEALRDTTRKEISELTFAYEHDSSLRSTDAVMSVAQLRKRCLDANPFHLLPTPFASRKSFSSSSTMARRYDPDLDYRYFQSQHFSVAKPSWLAEAVDRTRKVVPMRAFQLLWLGAYESGFASTTREKAAGLIPSSSYVLSVSSNDNNDSSDEPFQQRQKRRERINSSKSTIAVLQQLRAACEVEGLMLKQDVEARKKQRAEEAAIVAAAAAAAVESRDDRHPTREEGADLPRDDQRRKQTADRLGDDTAALSSSTSSAAVTSAHRTAVHRASWIATTLWRTAARSQYGGVVFLLLPLLVCWLIGVLIMD